jgi:VWFA-related protein
MRRLASAVLFLVAGAAHAQFQEKIDVVRILVDVRVTDSLGNAIPGLTPADFDINIGGKHAAVESIEFIEEGRASRPPAPDVPSGAESVETPAPGRLFIFFVQTDFARNAIRVQGQMHFLRYAQKLIDSFTDDDRFAVLQFDSHLKLRLDFTSDKEQVNEALRRSLRIDRPEAPPIVPEPSLASRLDKTAMKQAATSEAGLLILGNALRSIPGPKTILLLGWGLGELWNGRVYMTRKYEYARQALDAARTSIFAIDVPSVDFHSLEAGLQQAAEDTGGLYVKTFRFPQLAIERVQRTLAGHYEIELRRPDELDPGGHRLSVNVKRRGVIILAPTTYVDRH